MKPILRIIPVFAVLLLVGFGCKGLSKAQQTAVRPVSLNYWAVYENIDMIEQFAAEYQQLRPYVNINIRRVRADQFEELFVNALADDVGPDLISIGIRDLPVYISRLSSMPSSVNVANVFTRGGLSKETVVQPTTVQLPTATQIKRMYVSAVAEDVVQGGEVYGLPLSFDTLGLYYNTEILDQSGVPEPPADWSAFADAVKKTTRFGSSGSIIQTGVALGAGKNIENSFDLVSLLFLQNDIPLDRFGLAALQTNLKAGTVDTHPTFQALRFYTDFVQADKDLYSWNSSFRSARDEFIRGNSAFYFGFAYERDEINARAPQLNYDVVSIPQLDPKDPINVANFNIQAVTEKSRNQDEAWDFLNFITKVNNVERYATETNLPSPFRSHIDGQSQDPQMEPFLSTALNAVNWYMGSEYLAAREAFNDLLVGYVRPYGEDVDPAKRDIALIDLAVRVVDQTK